MVALTTYAAPPTSSFVMPTPGDAASATDRRLDEASAQPLTGLTLTSIGGEMLTAGIQELMAPDLPPWATVMPMKLAGRNVGAVVTSFEDEQERRADCGLGAIIDSALLRVLFQLPLGIPVPSRHLSSWERRVLARSPLGAAERRRGMVTRIACSPVKVELVVVRSRAWRCGIYWASQYGPFCRRVLALPSMPSDRDEAEALELEARIYGVGLVSTQHVKDGWLIPPAPFKPKRFSSGQWLFQERAYAEMLANQRQDN